MKNFDWKCIDGCKSYRFSDSKQAQNLILFQSKHSVEQFMELTDSSLSEEKVKKLMETMDLGFLDQQVAHSECDCYMDLEESSLSEKKRIKVQQFIERADFSFISRQFKFNKWCWPDEVDFECFVGLLKNTWIRFENSWGSCRVLLADGELTNFLADFDRCFCKTTHSEKHINGGFRIVAGDVDVTFNHNYRVVKFITHSDDK